MKAKVFYSPWPDLLPVGTIVKEAKDVHPRFPFIVDKGKVFVRDDGKLLWEHEPDGQFILWKSEYTIIEN